MPYCKKLEKSLVVSHLFTFFATEILLDTLKPDKILHFSYAHKFVLG